MIVGTLPAAADEGEVVVGGGVPSASGQDAAEEVALRFACRFGFLVIDIALERSAASNGGMGNGTIGRDGGDALRGQVRLAEFNLSRG